MNLDIRRSRARTAFAAIALTAPLLASLGAPAASAATTRATFSTNSWISSNSGGANMRTCSSTNCGSLGYLRNGTAVGMLCWEDNQWVYPPNSNYASPRWFRVGTYALGGTVGYLHSSLVAGQTSVGHC